MKYINKNLMILGTLCVAMYFASCTQDNLDPDDAPGVGGIVDITPPAAMFSEQQDAVDFLQFLFINESVSSTTQLWSIPEGAVLVGEGASLTDVNITVRFPEEGDFAVGLVASDAKLEDSEQFVEVIMVREPLIPIVPPVVILAAGFEDITDVVPSIDPRNAWGGRGSDFKRVQGLTATGISTGSRVRTGAKSAKFENSSDGLRQAYQEVAVTPNTIYRLEAYIKLGSDFDPTHVALNDEFRLAIMNQTFDVFDVTAFEGAFLESTTQDPTDEFTRISIVFDSGDNDLLVIYMDSMGRVETQVDDVFIESL